MSDHSKPRIVLREVTSADGKPTYVSSSIAGHKKKRKAAPPPASSSTDSDEGVPAKRVSHLNPADVSHIYDCDKIKLYLYNNDPTKVYVDCPVCEERVPYTCLGEHLQLTHNFSFHFCVGEECQQKKRRIGHDSWVQHIETHHFVVKCTQCGNMFNLKKFHEHMESHPPDILGEPSEELILDIKDEPYDDDDDQVPEPEVQIHESPVAEIALERDKSFGATGYLLDGIIVVINSIEYLVKDTNIFVDCPFCDTAKGLAVLGNHIEDDHLKTRFKCNAEGCTMFVNSQSIQTHLLLCHGNVNCAKCSKSLTILSVKPHMESFCPCIKRKIPVTAGKVSG